MFKEKIGITFMITIMLLAMSTVALASDISLGFVEWDCSVSQNHILAATLEKYFDMDVELVSVDAGFMWLGVAQGDLDVVAAAWLPLTHGHYWDIYGDDLVNLGVNYHGADIGLVVPQYVDIDSIDELNDHAADFNYMIVGIDPGAGIMAATEDAVDEYGLNLTLLDSSDAAMVMQLTQSYAREEPIVITGWLPHWKFDSFDLKFLEDPLGVYGESDDIYTIVRKDFHEDFSEELVAFFENYYLTDDELHNMMNIIQENPHTDRLELAKQWIEDNAEVVEAWIQ